MKKLIVAVTTALFALGANAAVVNLGQLNGVGNLDANVNVGDVLVGGDLDNMATTAGNVGSISVDATAFVNTGQANYVAFQAAGAGLYNADVGKSIDQAATSVGNALDIYIEECGNCADTASVVNAGQLNLNISNTAFSGIGNVAAGGSLSNAATAVGNAATIVITN